MMGTLSALSPFGPIFGKELRTTARRKRTYFLRFFYLLALSLIMLLVYSSTSYHREASMSVAERAQREAELGHAFFAAFSGFSVYALPLIAPILTATAISAERLGKTLPVLLMTPINSWQIISGKLLSRLLVVLTLIGLSLPVLAVVRLLGGVDLDRMIAVVCLLVVLSLTAAAIGLFYSTFMNRAYAVILLSYGTMLILYAFLPFALGMMLIPHGRPPMYFLRLLGVINPFFDVLSMIAPRNLGIGTQFIPCVILHLCFTGLLIFWSAAVLRRQARRQGESAATIAPQDYIPYAAPSLPPPVPATAGHAAPLPPPLPEIRGALPYASVKLPAPRRIAQRTVSDNPILWREIRRPLMARRWQAVLGSIVCVGLLLGIYLLISAASGSSRNALAEGGLQIGFAIIFCGLYTILICVLSATTIAGEKESDTWVLLLATPVSGRSIVMGKLLGTFRRLLWPTALIVGHFLIFTLFGVIPVSAFILIVWILITFNTVWIATGLYFSLKFQKVTLAVILNMLMPVGAYLLAWLLCIIVSNLIFDGRHRSVTEFVGLYTPYTYLISGIDGLTRDSSSGAFGYYNDLERRFWVATYTENLTASEFFQLVFAVGVGYLTVSALIIARTIWFFDRIVGRARQRAPIPVGRARLVA